MSQAKCSACGAIVLRVKTQAKKKIRIDAEPIPSGSLTWANLAHTRVRSYCDNDLPDLPRFAIHFSTCPNVKRNKQKEKP